MVEWSEENRAEPIPADVALESDVRFREDVVAAKEGDTKKKKVWKKWMVEQ